MPEVFKRWISLGLRQASAKKQPSMAMLFVRFGVPPHQPASTFWPMASGLCQEQVVKGGEKMYQWGVDVQRKCPVKCSGKMSISFVLIGQVSGPSRSPVDGWSWQVQVLPDRVSGNTQLFGDAP